MKGLSTPWRLVLATTGISAVPAAFLQALRLAAGAPFFWSTLAEHWLLVTSLLLIAHIAQPYPVDEDRSVWPWAAILALGLGAVATVAYSASTVTETAWAMLAMLYLLILLLDRGLANGGGVVWRWSVHLFLMLLGGVVPVSIAQIESQFAEEEFFVALQAVGLGLFTALLLGAQGLLARWAPAQARPGLRLDRRWLALLILVVSVIGMGGTIRSYQTSFYPPIAPAYEGISPETPFLCGEVEPDPQTYAFDQVHSEYLERMAENPDAEAPEFAMLALDTGEVRWAQAFRESLLAEAAEHRFTGPAHSVKSVQYHAARRAYYLPRVQVAFPGIFSDEESTQLEAWFDEINRRALTVEAVDWMYALAFSKLPEGPYENQDIGAGLLSLLEAEELAAPDLSPANQNYLARNPRGWLTRFRVPDDAIFYQPAWIHNAYFQSLYTGVESKQSVRHSFEWLLLQALPDAAPMRYNHPYYADIASIAYLGAQMLGDPRYVWLAGRALEDAEERGEYTFAQPGSENPVSMTGYSPSQGSCLIYGDSGLPNQAGPLAPDKIVFRDGWARDSAYLLLNLRFTGWHRYKGTNTVSLVKQGGTTLVSDALDGQPFSWLPEGRAAFRDKRIPRENMSGLLIPRTGMSAALYRLTGVGGPWAQDPPYYADVIRFESGDEKDWSHTRLTDWRGWNHDRWVYLYHDGGPIVVVDSAAGSQNGGKAALAWHLPVGAAVEEDRIRLKHADQPAEMLLVPWDQDGKRIEVTEEPYGGSGQRVVYYAPDDGQLRVITVFLRGEWVSAEIEVDKDAKVLRVLVGQRQAQVPLPPQE